MPGRTPQGSEDPIPNIVGERVALGPLRMDLLRLYSPWIKDLGAVALLRG
jgi:hypothetical protein